MLAFAGTHSLNTRPVALHVTPGRPWQVGGGLHVRMGSPAMEAYSGHLTSASPATAQTAAFGQAHHHCQQELDVTLEANQVCVGVQAGCQLRDRVVQAAPSIKNGTQPGAAAILAENGWLRLHAPCYSPGTCGALGLDRLGCQVMPPKMLCCQ
jgi:hypothetical protein